jgi:4-amino-4-deoxy-L-arabinose transferase
MTHSLFKKDLGNPFQILIYILIFYGVISFATMGSWGVIETSEARYAEISREMIQSKDWIHPTLLNIYHYHKPPIIYWITCVSLKIFGINGIGVRFFLQVAFLVQIVLVYRIATILLGEKRQGLYAAIIYAGLPIVLISVRGLTTDPYLQTFIMATIFSWLQWKKSSRVLWMYLTSFFASLAFLTKGPVALIIPAMTIIVFHKEYNTNHRKISWHNLLAILFGILISISWFLYLAFEDKTFIDYFLFHHTVERFANGETFVRSQPWWFYIWIAPLVALPWIIIIPFAFVESKKIATPTLKKILLYWIGIPLIFFFISSSKLVLYVLPLYTGLAIVCGGFLNSITIKFKAFENTFFFSVCFLSLTLFISTLVIKPLNAGWIPLLAVGLVGLMILMKFAVRKTYIKRTLGI